MISRLLFPIAKRLPTPLKIRLSRLQPVYGKLASFGNRTVTVSTAAGEFQWRVHELTSHRHVYGSYEPHMQAALRDCIRPGYVVYDVGANVGFLSLIAALLVKENGRVIAFEPDPENASALRLQLPINDQLNISVLTCAVTDHDGPARFNTSMSSSQRRVRSDGDIEIAGRTIDSLVENGEIPPPDIIKIDIEGHEPAALRGAMATLTKFHPVILCDINDEKTFPALRELLEPLGYNVRNGEVIVATAS